MPWFILNGSLEIRETDLSLWRRKSFENVLKKTGKFFKNFWQPLMIEIHLNWLA
jgi:hypothetical protein